MEKNIIIIAIIFIFSCSNGQKKDKNKFLDIKNIESLYPKIKKFSGKNDQIIKYSGFHLSYNEKHEQANWVIYSITKNKLKNSSIKRENNFYEIKNNITSATKNDYEKSGYDRGHLAPSKDMQWSKKSMQESFCMTNISPQKPKFNRGIWKKLENKIRDFALENDSIYVITGGILNKKISKKIGENKVSVPKYYFKVILDVSPPTYKGIAFLLKNKKSKKKISKFALSIDELEEKIGIDFFYKIKNIENIEKNLNIKEWNL
ncbi:MAG: hypothetical protein B6I24_05435 [Bacteroidetes bacterium 4572_128]|nr:MAG: hypothetical protein B6I24_05435 [Bacteroidetes bacterium 4572_128]